MDDGDVTPISPGCGGLLFLDAGMPLIAVVVTWLLAGRQPPVIARQPLE